MTSVRALVAISTVCALLVSRPALALDPSLRISQYGHTAWRVRDGFSLGAVFAMAQTQDGYLWLGSGFGVFRFDGVRFVQWQPPPDTKRTVKGAYSLLAARDGTLWMGTFEGLASWRDGRLVFYPELDRLFITSLLEDHEGTVWVGVQGSANDGRLCAVRAGRVTCSGEDGQFGRFVWSLTEDRSGTLWVGADTGVWRWRPGAPVRHPLPALRVGDLSATEDGRLLVGIRHNGLRQIAGDSLAPYPIRSRRTPAVLLGERDVDSNKLLRDRDGGLWIGTGSGLVHVNDGRADTFDRSDGLSGDFICGLFEDREGNIWVSTSAGLDRFREVPVWSLSKEEGLPTDDIASIVGARDGSVWLATTKGLLQWRDGERTAFHTRHGLPDHSAQSLFEDAGGRIWVFTEGGLAFADGSRFVAGPAIPSREVFSIAGDETGHLWLSGNTGLTHLLAGRVVEHVPWPAIGRTQQAKMVLADKGGGLWMSFWTDGGVAYFKDGRIRASYSAADGLGAGHVPGIALDPDGALWAATEDGGISRIKDGRIATLTTGNGLPCNTIHQTVQDESRSLWVYAACGLFRIARAQLDAWIAQPTRRVQTMFWDAADGVRLWPNATSAYGPFITRSQDGRLWFLTGEGVQVVDPRRLRSNTVRPPVHVQRLTADRQVLWEYVHDGATVSNLRTPPGVRDLQVEFTALTFVAPEKVRFKYKLEGQDADWREVVNDRHVQYSNLRPGPYRFRVIAANNSGLWNEQGDTLEFAVAPAYYQTDWFRALCVLGALGLLWTGYRIRVRQLRHDFEVALEGRIGERTRIARDLHDTLLQSFHGLLLRFQAASHLLPGHPAEAKQRLDDAIEHAANALVEGRDAVQGLRGSSLDDCDLATAIDAVGQELAAASEESRRPSFEVTVEGTPRTLHPVLRDDVYKITAEAIRNAFRHAAATRIDVEIRYAREQFRLRVQDDGKGFGGTSIAGRGPQGHFGLSGMRERADLIGGTLTVWTKEGAGTAVELCIPSPRAYVKPPKQRASFTRDAAHSPSEHHADHEA